MGVVKNIFFLDLDVLDKKGDEKLKEFALNEELSEKDIIKIIYNEANRIGVKDKVKVTFKILENSDDGFRVIVEPANIKYKGTIIYPFNSIKSQDFEINLDDIFGKVTLYNKKEKYKNMSVTIDYVALDLFSMTYNKAKDFLKNISDRKCENGYMEFPDSICFKQYGIKLNAKKDENSNVKVDDLVYSIDIYNKEEFFKEFYFEEKKYDVSIEDDTENSEELSHETIQIVDDDFEKDNIIDFTKASAEKNPKIDLKNLENEIDVEIPKAEVVEISQNKVEEKTENQKEIEELQALLEEEQRQQEILEQRIRAKLDELKNAQNSKEDKKDKETSINEAKEVVEKVEFKEPEGYTAYNIESYKGIKEQGKNELCVFLGQSKDNIRKYFGGNPKEIRDYEEMELYDVFYAYYDENDTCTGIGVYNQEVYKDKLALYFLDNNLITMKYRDIVSLIKNNDANAIEDEDGIISLKYGISIDPKENSNYLDDICDVIHIFKKGYYDEVYEAF